MTLTRVFFNWEYVYIPTDSNNTIVYTTDNITANTFIIVFSLPLVVQSHIIYITN